MTSLLFKFTLVARMSRQSLQAKFLILLGVYILHILFHTCLIVKPFELFPLLTLQTSSMRSLYALRTVNLPFEVPAQILLS